MRLDKDSNFIECYCTMGDCEECQKWCSHTTCIEEELPRLVCESCLKVIIEESK